MSSDPGSEPGDDPESGPGSGGGDAGYTWLAGEFGACSMPCGGGVQSRPVACVRTDGVVVADSLCTTPRPDSQQACNVESCTNFNCNPVFVNTSGLTTLTPTSGPTALTVTFDATLYGSLGWNAIDFGDGTTTVGTVLPYKVLYNGNVGAEFTCVNHTYTRPGTYSAGRILLGGTRLYEVTVVAK